MEISRRDALRCGGGLVAGAVVAGCVERRVTRREDSVRSSTTWGLEADAEDSLDESAFEAYVSDMSDIYGEGGVWGTGSVPDAAFQRAYVQRLPITRDASDRPGGAQPTLVPDEIDRTDSYPIVDAAVSVYRNDDGIHQYWLWAAVDVRNETFAMDVDATVLSSGVSIRGGEVLSTASVSREDGGEDGVVTLDDETVVRFPLEESTDSVGIQEQTDAEGYYAIEWNGAVGGTQSVNGAFEVGREGGGAFRWSVAGGYILIREV